MRVLKTMCGSRPVAHWPRNSDSSSRSARSRRCLARPMLMNAESQAHWCGYRAGDGMVPVPVQLASSTRAAAFHSVVSSPFSRVPMS
ncbi:hypothetical protein [Actinomadura keratinilytica]|uniref:hypothetical protein n=1 Tax=Actinomadura keratinilytica TaxID=547461 RepID=UPI003613A4FE